jgi:DNA-directed RNA polymerase III subunit RPC6
LAHENLTSALGQVDETLLAEVINALLEQARVFAARRKAYGKHSIVVQPLESGSLIYRALDSRQTEVLRQLDGDERIVYQHIQSAENQGIWMKDLLKNTNLHRQVVTKILKTLESRNFIKSVKSIKVCVS